MTKPIQRITLTLALTICWVAAVLAQPAYSTSIFNRGFTYSDAPGRTQHGLVYQKPRTAQELRALLGHLHGTQMTLAKSLAATELTDEQRQHLQAQLDLNERLMAKLQNQISTGDFAAAEAESEPGILYGPYE